LILAEWSCELPERLLDDFFQFAEQKLKPFYESYGCKRYALFIPVEKRYFAYQIEAKKTKYTEQILFSTIEDFERFLERVRRDPHAKEMTDSYRKKFRVKSVSFKTLTQKV